MDLNKIISLFKAEIHKVFDPLFEKHSTLNQFKFVCIIPDQGYDYGFDCMMDYSNNGFEINNKKIDEIEDEEFEGCVENDLYELFDNSKLNQVLFPLLLLISRGEIIRNDNGCCDDPTIEVTRSKLSISWEAHRI